MRTPDQRKDTPKGNGFITADIEAANKFLSLKASRTYSENSKINVLGGIPTFGTQRCEASLLSACFWWTGFRVFGMECIAITPRGVFE